jgi:hypothetical protein
LDFKLRKLISPRYILYIIYYILYNYSFYYTCILYYTLYIIYYTLYIIHYTLYIIHYTLYAILLHYLKFSNIYLCTYTRTIQESKRSALLPRQRHAAGNHILIDSYALCSYFMRRLHIYHTINVKIMPYTIINPLSLYHIPYTLYIYIYIYIHIHIHIYIHIHKHIHPS